MRKNLYAAVFFAFALSLGASLSGSIAVAGELDLGIPPEVVADFQKEAPLTQADIDAYLKMMPQIAATEDDPSKLEKLFEGSKISPTRVSLIGLKMALAIPMIQAGPAALEQMGQIPEGVRPNDAELELFEKNLPAIISSTMELMQGAGAGK